MPWLHQTFHPVWTVKLLGIMFRNRCWPPLFTLLQLEMLTNDAISGWCDQPQLDPLRQQTHNGSAQPGTTCRYRNSQTHLHRLTNWIWLQPRWMANPGSSWSLGGAPAFNPSATGKVLNPFFSLCTLRSSHEQSRCFEILEFQSTCRPKINS